MSTSKKPTRRRGPVKKAVVRRSNKFPEWIWIEIRGLYEGNIEYTQKMLCDYARSKGFEISQPMICKMIGQEGWIKGSKLAEMREAAEENLYERLGGAVTDMLGRHAGMARALQGQALHYLKVAAKKQKLDPDYTIPMITLRTLTGQLREAQDMEARSLGFDYRTGKPFSFGEDEDQKVEAAPRLIISEMTAAEQANVQANAEAEHRGEIDFDNDPGDPPGDADEAA